MNIHLAQQWRTMPKIDGQTFHCRGVSSWLFSGLVLATSGIRSTHSEPRLFVQPKIGMSLGQSAKYLWHWRLYLLFATVGLWVSVSHDQALFQPYAMTMGHSERSMLPESTICMSIPPAVALQSSSSLPEP